MGLHEVPCLGLVKYFFVGFFPLKQGFCVELTLDQVILKLRSACPCLLSAGIKRCVLPSPSFSLNL